MSRGRRGLAGPTRPRRRSSSARRTAARHRRGRATPRRTRGRPVHALRCRRPRSIRRPPVDRAREAPRRRHSPTDSAAIRPSRGGAQLDRDRRARARDPVALEVDGACRCAGMIERTRRAMVSARRAICGRRRPASTCSARSTEAALVGAALAQQRGDRARERTVPDLVRAEDAMREARMQRQRGAAPAVIGEPSVGVDDAELAKQALGLAQALGRGSVEEAQVRARGVAPPRRGRVRATPGRRARSRGSVCSRSRSCSSSDHRR